MPRQFLDIIQALAILSILLGTATASRKTDVGHGDHIVNVLNGLPKGSEALKNSCSNSTAIDIRKLNPGEAYQWEVKGGVRYVCFSEWTRFFQKWNAFDEGRDKNHAEVFWVVKKDGFYLSWDNSTWLKNAEWESE